MANTNPAGRPAPIGGLWNLQRAADRVRLMAAQGTSRFSAMRGTNRVQRWLAPPSVVRRNPSLKLIAYPFGPRAAAEDEIRWQGTTEHWVGWNAYFRKAYESETLAVMASLLDPGMRIIEVGANEGYHTVFAAWCVGARGVVHAYEPYGRPRLWLERNLARLGWSDRVRIHSLAVSAACREATFFVPVESEENQGVGGLHVTSNLQTVAMRVDVVTLDDRHSSEAIAFVKMDVQGGEADVLAGATGLLHRCLPALYFEVGDDGVMSAIAAAEGQGYVVRRVFPSRKAPFFRLSADMGGTWSGNCLAVHEDRIQELVAARQIAFPL